MKNVPAFCELVRDRRVQMGLSQAAFIEITGLGKTSAYEIQNGTLKNLGLAKATQLLKALGLEFSVQSAWRDPDGNTPLSRAAVDASRKQRKQIDIDFLRRVLSVKTHLGDYEPHLRHLLLTADVALLAAVVEQLHQENQIECSETWKRMRALSKQLAVVRPLWE